MDFFATEYFKLAANSPLAIAGELSGLGLLAVPTIHKWISGPEAVSERERDIAEVGGLGILAAPYAMQLARGKFSSLSPRAMTYAVGGLPTGIGSDVALHGSGLTYEDLPQADLEHMRSRNRVVDVLGALGGAAAGGLVGAGWDQPLSEALNQGNVSHTLGNASLGATIGGALGRVPAAVIAKQKMDALVEKALAEKERQKAEQAEQAAAASTTLQTGPQPAMHQPQQSNLPMPANPGLPPLRAIDMGS